MRRTRWVRVILVIIFSFLVGYNLGWGQQKECGKVQKVVDAYPAKPEEVVEAFVNADFKGCGLGYDVVCKWTEIQKYTLWEDAPGWDMFTVVKEFKIIPISQNSTTAIVKVEYKVIGNVDGSRLIKAKNNEIVKYKLIKVDGLWKIDSPQLPPHVGIKKAIEHLKIVSEQYENNLQQKQKIKQIIKELKKY